MEQFIELVQANGVAGLVTGFAVLVGVFLLNRGGVVASKGQKQLANAVLAIMLSGLSLLDPNQAEAVEALIASFASAIVYEFLRGGLPKLAKLAK